NCEELWIHTVLLIHRKRSNCKGRYKYPVIKGFDTQSRFIKNLDSKILRLSCFASPPSEGLERFCTEKYSKGVGNAPQEPGMFSRNAQPINATFVIHFIL